MPDMNPEGTHIIICDWRGAVKWISGEHTLLQEGDLAWSRVIPKYCDTAQQAFARTVSLREQVVLELENQDGRFFRVWMWPLDSPEMAVCILSVAMPTMLQQLSRRERETLHLLAQGMSSKEIAAALDVSVSTVHTHLRRVREKLEIPNLETLVSFAARHCHPQVMPCDFHGWAPGTDS